MRVGFETPWCSTGVGDAKEPINLFRLIFEQIIYFTNRFQTLDIDMDIGN